MAQKKNKPTRGAPKGNQRARKHAPDSPLRALSPRVSQAAYEALQGRAEEEGVGVTTLAARILEESALS